MTFKAACVFESEDKPFSLAHSNWVDMLLAELGRFNPQGHGQRTVVASPRPVELLCIAAAALATGTVQSFRAEPLPWEAGQVVLSKNDSWILRESKLISTGRGQSLTQWSVDPVHKTPAVSGTKLGQQGLTRVPQSLASLDASEANAVRKLRQVLQMPDLRRPAFEIMAKKGSVLTRLYDLSVRMVAADKRGGSHLLEAKLGHLIGAPRRRDFGRPPGVETPVHKIVTYVDVPEDPLPLLLCLGAGLLPLLPRTCNAVVFDEWDTELLGRVEEHLGQTTDGEAPRLRSTGQVEFFSWGFGYA